MESRRRLTASVLPETGWTVLAMDFGGKGMGLALLLKLIHVFLGFWLVAGLLGRWVTLAQAGRSTDVRITSSLVQLAGRFEGVMVIPGSAAVVVAGLLTAWAEGQPILGVVQGSNTNWLLVSLLLFLTLFPIIRWVFLPRGRQFGLALDGALKQGEVTPELRAAFNDSAVRIAHIYELIVIFVIIVLMVTKPF